MGETINMSESGLLFSSDQLLEIDASLEITFQTNGPLLLERSTRRAQVVRRTLNNWPETRLIFAARFCSWPSQRKFLRNIASQNRCPELHLTNSYKDKAADAIWAIDQQGWAIHTGMVGTQNHCEWWRQRHMNSETDPKRKVSFENFGRRLDEEFGDAARKVEQESERVISYLNDEVVPAIRNHSSKALRVAAEKLQRLAEFMDKTRSS
jgi:hypothetical protein